MIINTNVTALNTYSALSNANGALSKSTAKLSSGFRINTAADDAAGLAISEKMRSQINGLNQAERNAQDGISLLQTAEGALIETESILQRIRELAVQAANDTNTTSDRTQLQQEITQLTSELDRIADTTEFNTKKLLNGDSGVSVADGTIITSANATGDTTTGTYDVTVATLATAASDVTVGAVLATDTVNAAGTVTINGSDISIGASDTVQDVMDKINSLSGVQAYIDSTTGNFTIASTEVGANASLSISASADGIISATDAWNTTAVNATGANATLTTLDDPDAVDLLGDIVITGNKVALHEGTGKGLEFTVKAAGTTTIDVGGTLNLQIGANEGQTVSMSINSMQSTSLGIANLDVTTTTGANNALSAVDDAVDLVSSERARLGAYQNRLEHTINNLSTSAYNLTAAESRIRDVDMAKEMMIYTTQSILVQSSTAMLAQANQQPQSVLQLLG